MKQWGYFLIVFFPSFFCVIIVCFVIRFVKGDDVELIGRWIAENVFSDILKEEKREGGSPRWLFKDIDLTSQERILHRIWFASPLLFVGILSGAMVIFWHIFLLEVSSVCDVNDPSQDCFEVVVWDMPKQRRRSKRNHIRPLLQNRCQSWSGHRCKLWSIQAVHVGL